MKKITAALVLGVLLSACLGTKPRASLPAPEAASATTAAPELLKLYDASRSREVPVALYRPATRKKPVGLALLSHGYGGQYTDYSFIAQALAAEGYLVASVQHELPGDAPLATTGTVYQARMPSWQRGVQNLLFVRQQLQGWEPALQKAPLLLVGHSHGGDISMLLAQQQPALVDKVISLDNRRVPFPRASRPRVLGLRSSDQQADPGVLPTPAEQQQHGTIVVTLAGQLHNDMYDGASAAQKAEMLRHIQAFVK
ncbi:alpha/beta fold hydrolase [Hymenobacter saemangeumensis]|uniref:Alpha/beta fold hydrolase n=1 Tax=Hymenobacter saemangeumensis TaxID=1084522 RepID=A0ABP8HXS6_9BACT